MNPTPANLQSRSSMTSRATLRRSTRRLVGAVVATVAAVAVTACVPPADDTAPERPAPEAQNPGDTPDGNTAPAGTYVTAGERLGVGGCPLFPRNNAFHADISTLEPAANSDAMIAAVGPLPLGTVRSSIWQGSRGGIPINIVDSRTARKVNFLPGLYSYMSDLLDHPLPASPRIEGYPGAAWDKHLLVVDTATCRSHEFFYVSWIPFGDIWAAETAVKIDLTTNVPRPMGSAIASGGSMLAGMLRYEEVVRGEIDHALSVAVPTISNQAPVWPAFRTDGTSNDPNAPRMGSWLRLRDDVDLSGLGRDAKVIATALQRHGAIISDTGPGFGISGENDARWNDADLTTLSTLELTDFEVVDPTPMKVDDSTYEIR